MPSPFRSLADRLCLWLLLAAALPLSSPLAVRAEDSPSPASSDDPSPRPDERQLPDAMRSAPSERPRISVGRSGADLIGSDHRALQAAVDYIAALGGGVVDIGPGEYTLSDSLHLRSHVTVRGAGAETVLRKSDGVSTPLALDGDFGEEQITVEDPTGFQVGGGVAIWDDSAGGFHTTVARITGRRGRTFTIDKPLMADCMVHRGARAATVFPVVSGYDIEGAVLEDLSIDGNKDSNVHLNGCRGGGIFLYRAHGALLRRCRVRDYDGDGISFQQSNDVRVLECQSIGNTQLGLHPGSGSQRPEIRGCTARGNGTDGLFLCWRVRHGTFEENLLEGNGRFGISIGHKDSDNLLRRNHVRSNGADGVFFRNESLGMAPHRNRLVENIIEDNGASGEAAGIRIRGQVDGLVFERNTIRDSRAAGERTQTTGVRIEESVRDVSLEGNDIDADTPIDDRRADE